MLSRYPSFDSLTLLLALHYHHVLPNLIPRQNSHEQKPASCGSRPPLILLRRLMWLLSCWAEQIPASLRPALVQATANVMKVSQGPRFAAQGRFCLQW